MRGQFIWPLQGGSGVHAGWLGPAKMRASVHGPLLRLRALAGVTRFRSTIRPPHDLDLDHYGVSMSISLILLLPILPTVVECTEVD